MAETKKTTKATPKDETKAKTEEPKAKKPKTAPKPAAKPKAAAKPKSAPKPASAPKAEKTTESGSPPKAKATTAQMPDDWAKMVVNQLIEAQRMWLEMTTQQTATIFKTVAEVMGMSETAPTEALGKWAKQGVESFIAAQRQWAEMAMQQSAQLMKTVQSGANFGGAADTLGAAQGAAGKGLEMLVNMREAWLDFAEQQNKQMVKALKQNLKLDDSSPVAAFADFAQQTMASYVEIQKRWLDLATQMPFFGSSSKDKK